MSIDPAEARVHPRAKARVRVEYHYGSTVGVGHSSDVSEGGLYLACSSVAKPGTRIYLRLYLPGSAAGDPLKIIGMVTRAVKPTADDIEGAGMGIHFEVAYARTRESLAAFIENLLEYRASEGPIEQLGSAEGDGYSVRLGEAREGDRALTADEVEQAFSFRADPDVDWNKVRGWALFVGLIFVVAAIGVVVAWGLG